MTTQVCFLLPNREYHWPIHVEGNNRSPPSGRLANHANALPAKMLNPPLSARIVECHFFPGLWVNPGLASCLTQ
jgi:hypothetical protein